VDKSDKREGAKFTIDKSAIDDLRKRDARGAGTLIREAALEICAELKEFRSRDSIGNAERTGKRTDKLADDVFYACQKAIREEPKLRLPQKKPDSYETEKQEQIGEFSRLSIRLTKDELAEIELTAQVLGMSKDTFIEEIAVELAMGYSALEELTPYYKIRFSLRRHRSKEGNFSKEFIWDCYDFIMEEPCIQPLTYGNK